mgnify:FL=1
MPDQFDRLTPGQLMLLQEHHTLEHEFQQETAAFAGYCSGLAFGMAWNGKLEGFDQFYLRPTDTPKPETSTAEYKARYDSWQ